MALLLSRLFSRSLLAKQINTTNNANNKKVPPIPTPAATSGLLNIARADEDDVPLLLLVVTGAAVTNVGKAVGPGVDGFIIITVGEGVCFLVG